MSVSLKNDIDAPLVKTIGMINLLGIKTYWCCCGFNYEDQPSHKSHDYGTLQIFIERSKPGFELCTTMLATGLPFRIEAAMTAPNIPSFAITRPIGQMVRAWDNPQSVHYHEVGAQYITFLEAFLKQQESRMMDEILLVDHNQTTREKFPYWAYKPCEPWLIKKSEILA